MRAEKQRFACDIVRAMYDPIAWIVFLNLGASDAPMFDCHIATTVHVDLRRVRKQLAILLEDALVTRRGESYAVDWDAAWETVGARLLHAKQNASLCPACQAPIDLVQLLLVTTATDPTCPRCEAPVDALDDVQDELTRLYDAWLRTPPPPARA